MHNHDFICTHCRYLISVDLRLCHVHNRNHCPYCLWSKHLDLYQAGDRLSACKAPMQPIGLTLKQSVKKYAGQGELMLVHLCFECSKLSLNRIAADDDVDALCAVFAASLRLPASLQRLLSNAGIQLLHEAQSQILRVQLFGRPVNIHW